MIVWSGKGIIPIIFLVVMLVISTGILPEANTDFGFVIAFIATGIFCRIYGNQWNQLKLVIDEQSGQKMISRNQHTIFWIPVQYWAYIFSIFGIIFLFQNSLMGGLVFTLGFIVLIFLERRFSTNKPDEANPWHNKIVVNENEAKSTIEDEFVPMANMVQKEVVETITKKTIADSDKTGNVKRKNSGYQEVINIAKEGLKTENTLVEDPKANINKQSKNLNPFQLSRKTYKKDASNSGKKEEESAPYEKSYITELKNERGKTKEFKPSDPSRFMPKPDDKK